MSIVARLKSLQKTNEANTHRIVGYQQLSTVSVLHRDHYYSQVAGEIFEIVKQIINLNI